MFLGDTGNQIDASVYEAVFYPDSRSDNKGSEPKMVTSLSINGINYIATSVGWANGIALISLAIPKQLKVVDVAAIDTSIKAEKVASILVSLKSKLITKWWYMPTDLTSNKSSANSPAQPSAI